MKEIASTAGVICAVVIAVSLVSLIVPQGSTRRVMNTVIGVFVLCCMIVPVSRAVSGFKIDFDVPKLEKSFTASADEAYQNALLRETRISLENSAKTYLLSKGCRIRKIKIILNSDDKKGIYITRFRIYINKNEVGKYSDIISLIENKFEKTPEITVT